MVKVVDQEMKRENKEENVSSNQEQTVKTNTLQAEGESMSAGLYIMRLIETHEHRSRPKGKNSLTDEQNKLFEVIESMARNRSDKIVFRGDIVSAYNRRFRTDPNMLPTDFCYNSVNRGPDFEAKFLLKQERGKFKFVGFDWPADDKPEDIEWTPKGGDVPEGLRGKPFKVGTYHKGAYSWDFHKELAQYL